MAEFRPGTADQAAFLAELVERGLLIESGVPGVYGRGGDFEDVRARRRRAGHARRRARTSPSACASRRCCRAASSRRSAT